MSQEPLQHLIRSLSGAAGEASGVADARLVERFVAGDEAAFELLLWRHGPMVLGVCRRILHHAQDVEDAFQAAFLALARRASAIARREAVGSWLYQVACRIALRARADRARRTGRERVGVNDLAAPPVDPAGCAELRAALDEEVIRLPARQRSAFVLCCLEGKTGEEAAQLLGCAPGTITSRLTRARLRLRRRLARRGFAPTALALLLSGEASAALPAPLVGITLRSALAFAAGAPAGPPTRAVAYAEGALRAMFLTRLKVPLLLALLGVLAAGASLLPALAAPPPATRAPDRETQAEKPRKVPVVRVVQPVGSIASPCTIRAAGEDVFAAVAGVLTGQTVNVGARVKKGQVLARIDAPSLEFAEKEARAGAQQFRGEVRAAEARVVTARAAVRVARAVVQRRQAERETARELLELRQRQLARVRKLGKAASESELEEKEGLVLTARGQVAIATSALAGARAEVELMQGKLAEADAAVVTAKGRLAAAEVALGKAGHALARTRVVAPIDGVIDRLNYRNGDRLRAGERDRALPLFSIRRPDRACAVIHVSPDAGALIDVGARAELTINSLAGAKRREGTVTRVAPAPPPLEQTVRVEVEVADSEGLLRPGTGGALAVWLERGGSFTADVRVPASAVVPLPRGRYAVYVIEDGRARRREVDVYNDELAPKGRTRPPNVSVYAEGLTTTDLVVLDPRGLTGESAPVQVAGKPGAR
jgi:RND family efflux transporter MFP subunit